jgi:hypothetical protein
VCRLATPSSLSGHVSLQLAVYESEQMFVLYLIRAENAAKSH